MREEKYLPVFVVVVEGNCYFTSFGNRFGGINQKVDSIFVNNVRNLIRDIVNGSRRENTELKRKNGNLTDTQTDKQAKIQINKHTKIDSINKHTKIDSKIFLDQSVAQSFAWTCSALSILHVSNFKVLAQIL